MAIPILSKKNCCTTIVFNDQDPHVTLKEKEGRERVCSLHFTPGVVETLEELFSYYHAEGCVSPKYGRMFSCNIVLANEVTVRPHTAKDREEAEALLEATNTSFND